LNSSLAEAASELLLAELAISGRLTLFLQFFSFVKNGVLSHNSGSRYARTGVDY